MLSAEAKILSLSPISRPSLLSPLSPLVCVSKTKVQYSNLFIKKKEWTPTLGRLCVHAPVLQPKMSR